MKKFLCIIFVFSLIFMIIYPVHASSNIECSYKIEGNRVMIKGHILDIDSPKLVALLVGTPTNILYVAQTVSNSEGNFEFEFPLSESLPDGSYQFKINYSGSKVPYTGTLNYVFIEPTVTREFINSDIDVNIRGYVPTIEGTLSCIEGKTTTIRIVNATDNTVIAEDTVTSENGVCDLSYTLPSMLLGKTYSVTISCAEDESTLVYINALIDSDVVLVTVSGEIQVADNVRLDAQLQSEYIDFLNKNSSITTNRAISKTIPNIVSYMSCSLDLQGYETIRNPLLTPESDATQLEYVYNLSGEKDLPAYVLVNIKGIPYLHNRVFSIEYDYEKLQLVDACALTYDKEVSVGAVNGTNVEILSVENGKVVFKVNQAFSINKVFSGIVNLLEFKKLVSENVSITSRIESVE